MNSDSQINPNKYIFDTKYTEEQLNLDSAAMRPYDKEMVKLRIDLVRRYGAGKTVLDLCCGTGSYLRIDDFQLVKAIGIDFSSKMLRIFKEKLGGEIPENLLLINGDARSIALQSGSIDFIYSFTSLYYVPDVSLAIREIARVLKPGGFAAFELGNQWSLNTYVCHAACRKGSVAKPFHVSRQEMLKMIQAAGLKIQKQRVFQLLPMWGGGLWIRPLTDWRWKWLMELKFRGRMLDELISGLWPLRSLAFRHLFLCQKFK
jgi:ubiquinone/menaquinone biosynthesis C-methylase UbiE